jgi:hypothetical protein
MTGKKMKVQTKQIEKNNYKPWVRNTHWSPASPGGYNKNSQKADMLWILIFYTFFQSV